MQTDMYV